MRRIHRQTARDVARAAGVPVAQLLAVRDGETATLAVEGPALRTPSLRREVGALLARPQGLGAVLAALADGAAWATAPCERELASLLWPRAAPEGPRSAFFAVRAGGGAEPLVVRLVLAARPRRAELRALEAVVQLAAGRIEAEGLRREVAGRTAAQRALDDAAGEAILIADAATGRLLDGNRRLCELTGRRPEALRRVTLARLLDHPSLDAAAVLARLASAPVVREDELRLRRRRGEPLPVEVTAARVELHGRPALHLIARDVKRQRRAMVALRHAKDTLAALHLAGAHLAAETDEAAIYGVLARELVRLGFHCGVLAPEAGGTALSWRVLSFPARLRRAVERVVGRPLAAVRIDPLEAPRLRRCLSGRHGVQRERPGSGAVREVLGAATPEQVRKLGRLLAVRQLILAPLRREGRPVAVLVVSSPRLRGGDAEAIEAFALQASIALEKARLFSALREERARLETEVERRTAELRRAVAALEETDRRKDNFLANISHELRTPLVTVLGYADLVLAEKLGPLTARQRTALQVVATSGRRLKAFIEELLELSRHEITREAYAFAPVQLGEVLTQGVLALAPRFAERGLRVRVRVARGTPAAWADRERMLQVVVNLLANAERYTPDGGAIHVAAARGAGRVALSITDRGAGIAEEHLAHIFDRLYQVRDDRSPRHRGGALGIGLALVKSIVEAHGGAVTVRSRVGRGTRFRLSIPEAGAGRGAAAAAPRPVRAAAPLAPEPARREEPRG